jgi:hypothetical protein
MIAVAGRGAGTALERGFGTLLELVAQGLLELGIGFEADARDEAQHRGRARVGPLGKLGHRGKAEHGVIRQKAPRSALFRSGHQMHRIVDALLEIDGFHSHLI